jgi:geranylgeranyl reductase family protein
MEFDAIVVGAGPAGSTAAKFLAENGVKVLLLDKSKFPRDKPCGGGIPIRSLKRFKYIQYLLNSYTYGGCLHSTSLKYKVEFQKDEPILGMVLRKHFDHGLVNFAIESGATFRDCSTVDDVTVDKGEISVKLNDGTNIHSQLVIGADGVWSTVAKKSGLGPNPNVGMSIYQEIPLSTEIMDRYYSSHRIAHVHLKLQGIAGYGWIFPKNEHVNIGVCEFESTKESKKRGINLKDVYKKYIDALKRQNLIPADLKGGNISGAALPLRPLKKTYANRILLCGDAAGLINPVTGEGIAFALLSGEIAANVAIESLSSGDTSAKFLSKYETLWKKDFGKDIKAFLNIQKRWRDRAETVVKLASGDKVIAEYAFDVAVGNVSIHEIKWKLARRFIFLYFKDLFRKNK